MNPTRHTHRVPVTLAGLAVAALALPAWQGTASAASHRPHHHAAQVTVQQTENGLAIRDLQDLANIKRELQVRTQQMKRDMTFADLHDLAKDKRGLFRS